VLEILPFSAEHGRQVGSLISQIQREEFGIPITLEAQPDLNDVEGFYQQQHGNFWVAISEGKVIGTIALLDLGNGQGALRKMFVERAHRGAGSGVAQRLLETLLAWCESKGVRELYLGTTAKFLAAHRFYEKTGFVEIDKSALPASFPIMTVDTKFYSRRLG
jgi:N-acetylglutamate synthase-like GNAT family acetyltransferase